MTLVNPVRYMRKPIYVNAVQVTEANMEDVAKWCGGLLRTTKQTDSSVPKARYIKIHMEKVSHNRDTMAFEGDWVLQSDRGFKIYTKSAFPKAFDLVAGPEAVAEIMKESVSASA